MSPKNPRRRIGIDSEDEIGDIDQNDYDLEDEDEDWQAGPEDEDEIDDDDDWEQHVDSGVHLSREPEPSQTAAAAPSIANASQAPPAPAFAPAASEQGTPTKRGRPQQLSAEELAARRQQESTLQQQSSLEVPTQPVQLPTQQDAAATPTQPIQARSRRVLTTEGERTAARRERNRRYMARARERKRLEALEQCRTRRQLNLDAADRAAQQGPNVQAANTNAWMAELLQGRLPTTQAQPSTQQAVRHVRMEGIGEDGADEAGQVPQGIEEAADDEDEDDAPSKCVDIPLAICAFQVLS